MVDVLETVNGFVWGIPALILIIGVGLYLSVRTGFIQLRLFPKAMRAFAAQLKSSAVAGGTSGYRALCTALAATVGTGNLAGVAGAIAIGGPGAIFWMWISGVLGMVTKFAEATLAVRFRTRNRLGEWVGGPMYMIQKGLGAKYRWLAGVYCFFAVVASFGVGNATQINAVVGGVNGALVALGGKETIAGNLTIGIVLSIMITKMLLGGAKRIGRIAEYLVPLASMGYILLSVIVLVLRYPMIPKAFSMILEGAFSPKAVSGGVLGSMFVALRIGTSRGVFTNEAGLGTASIAHASADVQHPVEQGLMGIMEVFLDTIVICTLTALVILCSGVVIPYGSDPGIRLTSAAFGGVLGDWVNIPIAIFLCLFAFATVLGWGLYGARSAQYLFGEGSWRHFVYMQSVMVVIGAVLGTGTVWVLAETVNGLMVIPNLIALICLSPELLRLVKDYRKSA